MMTGAVWAVVPVKRFTTAKSRLAPVLDETERARFARLMFEDVLDALAGCRKSLAGIVVVTADEDATILARERQAAVVVEPAGGSINAALGLAVRRLDQGRDDGMIVVPSDIPHLSPDVIAMAADAISRPRTLAAVAATDDGGTNLLACRPADAIPLCFGPRSFERHCRAARRAGIVPQVLDAPDIGLDIDRPENLAAFLSLQSRTRAHTFLRAVDLSSRLERYSNSDWRLPGYAAAGKRT